MLVAFGRILDWLYNKGPILCMFQLLLPKVTVNQLEQLRLPISPLMLENATFLMQGDNLMAWPLICDPNSRVQGWLRSYLAKEGLVEVRYSVGDEVLKLKSNIIPVLIQWSLYFTTLYFKTTLIIRPPLLVPKYTKFFVYSSPSLNGHSL